MDLALGSHSMVFVYTPSSLIFYDLLKRKIATVQRDKLGDHMGTFGRGKNVRVGCV